MRGDIIWVFKKERTKATYETNITKILEGDAQIWWVTFATVTMLSLTR